MARFPCEKNEIAKRDFDPAPPHVPTKNRVHPRFSPRPRLARPPSFCNGSPLMCGIVGYIGQAEAAPILLDGLRRLEYRGYDSAGVATIQNGAVEVRKCIGRIANLSSLI